MVCHLSLYIQKQNVAKRNWNQRNYLSVIKKTKQNDCCSQILAFFL